MDKWEYLTAPISWDKDKKNWVTTTIDKTVILGFSNILNHYGEQGWELVNLVGAAWNSASFQGAYSSIDTYRAVFKRRK